MKEVQNIYRINKPTIDELLHKNGFAKNYSGLISAVEILGDPFVYEMYSDISRKWSRDDGDTLWSKFKTIFHKATGAIATTNNLVNVADSKLNPDADNLSKSDKDDPDSAWSPKLLYWAVGGVVFILILLLTIFFINSKQIKT
jgi:hypothetical protein